MALVGYEKKSNTYRCSCETRSTFGPVSATSQIRVPCLRAEVSACRVLGIAVNVLLRRCLRESKRDDHADRGRSSLSPLMARCFERSKVVGQVP